jgi:hypothetical protein
MSLAEIEAELDKMTTEELHRLALKSWAAFVEKETATGAFNECSEDDPQLLAALDEAIQKAEAAPLRGHSGDEVRSRLSVATKEMGQAGRLSYPHTLNLNSSTSPSRTT